MSDLPTLTSKTCITFVSTTLDEELFMPVQFTTVPSKLLVTLFIVMVDTKGSSLGEESREKAKVAKFIISGGMFRD